MPIKSKNLWPILKSILHEVQNPYFFPFNLLSFIHGNSDTQVGWKVAKFFFLYLDSEDFQEKRKSAILMEYPCLLIKFNSHKWT